MRYLTDDVSDVVLATDFSSTARAAFDAAVRACRLFGARLHLLHVNEEEEWFGSNSSEDLARFIEHVASRRSEALEQLEREAGSYGVETVSATRTGNASEGTLQYVDEVDAGLVVVGMVGAVRLRTLLTGTTARRIMRSTKRPLMLIPPHARVVPAAEGGSFRHLLYPTDLGDAAHRGLGLAEHLVSLTKARLSILHVLKLPTVIPGLPGEPPLMIPAPAVDDLQNRMQRELDTLTQRIDVERVQTLVETHASIPEGIGEVAERETSDLIVIPRHRDGSHFFGRTAENVARSAPAPVLAFSPLDGEG